MEQLSSQTEKISTYETSRTRLSLVDENRSISNNDDDFQMDGFYVREKSDKRNDAETVPNTNNEDYQHSEANIDTTEKHNNEVNNETNENNLNKQFEDGDDDNTSGINIHNLSKDLDQGVDNPTSQNKNIKKKVHCDSDVEKDDVEEETNNERGNNDVINANGEDNAVECYNNVIENINEHKIDNGINDSNKKTDIVQEGSSTQNSMPDSTQVLINGETCNESDEIPEEQESVINQDKSKTESNNKNINKDKQLDEIDDNDVPTVNEQISNDNESEEKKSNKLEQNTVNESTLDEQKDTEIIQDTQDDSSRLSEKNTSSKGAKGNRVVIKRVLPKREPTRRTNRNIKKNSNQSEGAKKEHSELSNLSILKEHLERREEMEDMIQNDVDMDEDFDPSLLCPDISMDVDEASVITNNEDGPDDGKCSPLPYEAVFSEMVDEITGTEVEFELTPKELQLKRSMFGPNNPVHFSKIHCTACNLHLGSALAGANNRFVHPLLKVLICKNCYHFYTSGEFEKDEDGSELYCRWCGQGGQVLCCSSCEYVFCKRCIRNNFGQKKFKEIRDSDDWNCFRCDAPQLSYLRAACSEFMDYYRNEMARVRPLAESQPELMTTDYTKCCSNPEPKPEESKVAPQAKLNRRKRKDSSDDPDYKPVTEEEEVPKKMQRISFTPVAVTVPSSGFRPLLPKLAPSTPGVRQILLQPHSNIGQVQHRQVFRVGNTTFRAKSMSTPRFAVRPSMVHGQNSILKTLPQRMPAPQPATIIAPNKQQVFATVRIPNKTQTPPSTPGMKHEWFEKTVRAAARVNSNLSYTLTQLNRQQSQANNVEALAVVHNKLQEVLSSSINSLIQIRKNLRTEFIAGIKNVKFPQALPTSNTPIMVKDDDDVIIVNSSATRPTTTSSPPPLVFASGTSTAKTTESKATKPASPKAGPSSTRNNSMAPIPRGGFLKVRSFSALQNVTSECITIPDDPPAPKVEKDICPEKDETNAVVEEPVIIDDPSSENGERDEEKADTPYADFVYNVTEQPTPEVQKMMDVVIEVRRSRVVDEIMRMAGLLPCTMHTASSDQS
ncbi:hypothetical protein GWI33_002041 [Rhynchophorus ferrugineus]|uniref:PHD-type domain-containing protein n=1 Tax=Rhynchophorus ferrugineus TaxID=354439 RepID=A0A834MLN2_RHYFE|nr:hypothetical protein GWI33_002041 [Rhynchophorus ferrugineus]